MQSIRHQLPPFGSIQILVAVDQHSRIHGPENSSDVLLLTYQFCCSETESVEACTPITLVSCLLLLLLRLDLGVLVLVECLFVCSCVPIDTSSLDGSSGGASGHGVRFDGTVMSKGGSIIHLHEIGLYGQRIGQNIWS